MLAEIQTTVGEIFTVLRSIVDVVLLVAIPLGSFFLRRLVNQFDLRVGRLEQRSTEEEVSGRVGDEKLKTLVARDVVSKAEYQAYREEGREDRTRIFSKIETLQVGQGKVEGKLEGLSAAITGLMEGIGKMVAEKKGT
jgi:hypothetical protein